MRAVSEGLDAALPDMYAHSESRQVFDVLVVLPTCYAT